MKTALLLGALGFAATVACSASSHGVSDIEADAAADSAATCPPTPSLTCQDPKSPPSYASDVVPILKERCSPCHFPGGIMAADYDFATYTGVVNAQTAIIGQLYACLMPPIHGNAMYGIAPGTVPGLTAEQLDTIIDWIECGAPNN
jgi:hypothetical protein